MATGTGRPAVELCVVSGKGGTGKTTVAVGLAVSLAGAGAGEPRLVDCDVEAPNAHLYLRPDAPEETEVTVMVPVWDPGRCCRCGACANACAFGALGLFGDRLVVFPEHCHGCGACGYVCPEGALSERPQRIGVVNRGRAGGVVVTWGVLDVGQPRAVPVIEAARARGRTGSDQTVLDGPPGTACSLAAAARGVDGAVVVTEPTAFGLHDLELAWESLRVLGVPAGVVINKAVGGRGPVHAFCERKGLPVLLEIPLDRAVAEAGAAGTPLPDAFPRYRTVFQDLWEDCAARFPERTSP